MAKFGFGIGSGSRDIMDIVDGYQKAPAKKKKVVKKKATKKKSR
jgi:hypothetical protein